MKKKVCLFSEKLLVVFLYLSFRTRHDLYFAVIYGSHHIEIPSDYEISILKRIKIFKGKQSLGAVYKTSDRDKNWFLIKMAAYTGDSDIHKSTTGCVICFCGGPVNWSSYRQPNVTILSFET